VNKLWKVVIICVGIIAAVVLYLRYEKNGNAETEAAEESILITDGEDAAVLTDGESVAGSGFTEQQKEELKTIVAEVIASSCEEQIETSIRSALETNLNQMIDDGRLEAAVTEYTAVQKSLININTAGAEELTKLNGIGTAKAQAIIAYREEHGPFQAIGDLSNVSGISDATIEKFKDQVAL